MERIEWLEKYMLAAERLIIEDCVEEGLVLLNSLLYEEPGYGRLHNHLGWAYMYYTSDVEMAELHLKMAIRFEEEYHAPYIHLANLYVRLGRYSEAIAIAQDGVTRNPADKLGLLEILAHAYELQGEYKLAIKSYREAVMASANTREVNNLVEGVKRCRRKRLASFLQSRRKAIGNLTRMLLW